MLKFREKVVLLTEGLNRIDGFRALDPTATFYVFPNVAPVCNRARRHEPRPGALHARKAPTITSGSRASAANASAKPAAASCASAAPSRTIGSRRRCDFIPTAISRRDRVESWLAKNPQYRLAQPYATD